MKLLASSKMTEQSLASQKSRPLSWRAEVRSLLLSWEFYLISLIASFLRLYQIQTTEFDTDQADMFRIAYDAFHHGLLPATTNEASLHSLNPPATALFLMIPAAFSANPLWGAVEIAILGILAVALTYVFVRRYYGRLAGTFAGLLYATAVLPSLGTRFIWNPNYLPIFVLLFFFALFRGVVQRRKGWLFPAIFLVGVMYQFHGTATLLVPTLLVAWLLAPGTARGRDLISSCLFGVLSLLIIYAPYIVWLISSHFNDIAIILSSSKQPAHIDDQAFIFYKLFMTPFQAPFTDTRLHLFKLVPYIDWIRVLMPKLALAGGIVLLGIILWPRRSETATETPVSPFWRRLLCWWNDFRADTTRCGMIVLLVWSITPLVALTRHTIPLYPQYFIIFMPAPFILVALLLAKAVAWLQKYPGWDKVARFSICLLVALIVTGQAAATGADIQSVVGGRNVDSNFNPYHNDLQSLQQAIGRADNIAQQRHLNHLYVSIDAATDHAMRFLSEHTTTPATAFSDSCWMFPAPSSGPAIMLMGPYADFTPEIQSGLAHATLLEESPRRGGPPFKIYLVEAPALAPSAPVTYPQHLQYSAAQSFVSANGQSSLVVRWNILRSAPASFQTTYTYTMTNMDNNVTGDDKTRQCTSTALQPGDQLLTVFPVHKTTSTPASLDLQVQYYKTEPLVLSPRLLHPLGLSFLTGETTVQDQATLRTANGKESLIIPTTSHIP